MLEEPAEQRNGVEDGWTSCAGGVRMAMTMLVLLGLARALCFALASVLGATLLAACASTGQTVRVPWRAGNAESFQMGVVEERQAHAAQGVLPVTMYRPAGAGPFPFIVLLHGCGGLQHEASWTQWVLPWADLFRAHGIGTAVVDSFGPRGVDQVCTGDVAAWAVRRADDAYSTRAWLADHRFSGDIWGYAEGDLYFPFSPLAIVEGTFAFPIAMALKLSGFAAQNDAAHEL